METQVAQLDLAAAANILNALVSLINENANLKAVVREQQSLLSGEPDNSSPNGDNPTPTPEGDSS